MGRNSPRHQPMVALAGCKAAVQRDLGVPVDKLNVSQQCTLVAKEANSILGCIKNGGASRSGEMIFTCHPDEAASGILYPVPQYKRDMCIQEQVQCGTTKGLEHLAHEERQRELGTFNLEKRRLT